MKQDTLLEEKAKLVRSLILRCTTEAGSGHPTSSLSATDIGTVLFDKFYAYDLSNPHNLHNDRFILSKGHASPFFFSLYAVAGAISFAELMTLRKFGSRLEGHPTPYFPYTEAATGSLGQGLSVGAGMAYIAQKEKLSFKTYVMLGDGEMAEGSVWESANFASYYKLDNLIAIVDVNRLGQSQATMFQHHTKAYVDRFKAFGWEAVAIDGHDLSAIEKTLRKAVANKNGKPFAIVAETVKGKGVSFLEDKDNWHGKPLKKEDLVKALEEVGQVNEKLRFSFKKPKPMKAVGKQKVGALPIPYKRGDEIATREVYGTVLAELGNSDESIYALDGDVKNSTFSQDFLKVHPERFIECFIAEQNMVGVALGLSRLNKKPFVSTFAAFLTRAFDQIRMAAVSRANITFVGSHAGVSIGEDGASQMGLEDIAMLGTLPESVVVHPADAVSTAKLLPLLVAHKGIAYLRTLRSKTAVLYDAKETFPFGGSKILKKSADDSVTIVAAGITVSEALHAYAELKKDGITVRIIDCYSIKPIDQKTLLQALSETKKHTIITVEDHFIHGGLGDFVLEAVSESGGTVVKLAVDHISRSGQKDEVLADAKINAHAIISTVKKLLKK